MFITFYFILKHRLFTNLPCHAQKGKAFCGFLNSESNSGWCDVPFQEIFLHFRLLGQFRKIDVIFLYFYFTLLHRLYSQSCRAAVLLCQANAWSWAWKSEKLKRRRWFMRRSVEPHSRAAPYWTLTSLLTTRLVVMPSPSEAQKTHELTPGEYLISILFVLSFYFRFYPKHISYPHCPVCLFRVATSFRSQEDVKKMERLHGLCLTRFLESKLTPNC